jgi:G protein-coupled receptor 107
MSILGIMMVWLFILAMCASMCQGLIHNLRIIEDTRTLFEIETFGFNKGGMMNLEIKDFKLSHFHTNKEEKDSINMNHHMGFVLRRSDTESEAGQDLEKTIEDHLCPFTSIKKDDILIDLSIDNAWETTTKVIHEITTEDEAGLYTLFYARCSDGSEYSLHDVSFELDVIFKNVGNGIQGIKQKESSSLKNTNWDYLSAGDQALPLMYMIFFILFTVLFLIWLAILRRTELGVMVHKIHYMMAVLLILKCLTLLTESIRYHMLAIIGKPGFMSILFYIFQSIRGIMLFTVILLIGSGWTIMKSFLNKTEKKLIAIVLIAQVINEVAMIVLDETAPGSVEWSEWRFAMHIFDLICCITIVIPIVWSIKHLREAVESDRRDDVDVVSGTNGDEQNTAGSTGKKGGSGTILGAASSIQKLRLFRSFYIMVVSYIYFTRIIVYLVEATVRYDLEWIGPFCTELATLAFYVSTGYRFQPTLDNPYLSVAMQDDDDDDDDDMGSSNGSDIDREFGYIDNDDDDDGGVQMGNVRNAVRKSQQVTSIDI